MVLILFLPQSSEVTDELTAYMRINLIFYIVIGAVIMFITSTWSY